MIKFNLNNLITIVSSDSDSKGILSVRVLMERSDNVSLLSNGKCAININYAQTKLSDSHEQKYTH